MSWPQRLSRLAISLLIAGSGLAGGMPDHSDEADPKEPPNSAPQPSIEKHEARDETIPVEHSEESSRSTPATKGGDHKNTDQGNGLLILLLEILRSSK